MAEQRAIVVICTGAVGSKSGAERGRSQSLYTKGQLHVVSVCVCVFVK